MTQTYFSVLEVTPTSQDWLEEYTKVAGPRVAHYGGRYIAKTTEHMTLEGNREQPAVRAIIQWPSKQAALDFMQDPIYKPQLDARTQGSISHHALVEGLDLTEK